MGEDTFRPREYQEELVNAVLANIAQGRTLTLGLAAPGYGKQNAAIWTATNLARLHGIPLSMHFVPRVNLAGQYEIGFEGPYWRRGRRVGRDRSDALIECFAEPRLHHLEHRPNADPLVPADWQAPFGIVACYASLVKDMGPGGNGHFRDLAAEYRGRFLLHADEAQFCGAAEYGEGDSITGGVKAGAYIEELAGYAFHTLLQTGTENRADGEPLVLCAGRYADPQNPGEIRGPLIPDAEGKYGRGRELGYLREFEVDYIDDHVVEESLDRTERAEYELSVRADHLGQVLRRERVYAPLVDKVMQRLEERQKIWPHYKAIICCMDQEHARQVARYLETKYRRCRMLMAISGDASAAVSALRDFRARDSEGRPSPWDVLVTVRMAFVGYDCKEITVLGILTNYRDRGHLYQQVGRALRVLPGRSRAEQVCWIVAPKDPRMRQFIEWLKKEQKRGTRGPGDGGEFGDAKMLVSDAYATGVTAEGLDGVVDDPDEYAAIEKLREQLGIYEPATKLKKLKDIWSGATPTLFDAPAAAQEPQPSGGSPTTSKDLVRDLNKDVRKCGGQALGRCGILAKHPRYGAAMDWFYEKVAALSFWSADAKTPERAAERLAAAEKVRDIVIERGELWW